MGIWQRGVIPLTIDSQVVWWVIQEVNISCLNASKYGRYDLGNFCHLISVKWSPKKGNGSNCKRKYRKVSIQLNGSIQLKGSMQLKGSIQLKGAIHLNRSYTIKGSIQLKGSIQSKGYLPLKCSIQLKGLYN